MTEYGILLRHAIQGVWRRRRLLVILIMLLGSLSALGALLQPRTYVARTLLLLQEGDRVNPLTREPVTAPLEPIQARIVSLKAILFSDHVLSEVINRTERSAPISGRELTLKMQGLQQSLSLDLIGTEGIELRLSGNDPNGLGNKLAIVLETLLQTMMPQEGGMTAAKLLINKQEARLTAAQGENAALKQELRHILPGGLEAAQERIADLERELTPSVSGRPEAPASNISGAKVGPGELDGPKNATDLATGATNQRAGESRPVCEARAATLTSPQALQKPAQIRGDADQALGPAMLSCDQIKSELSNLKDKISRYEALTERVTASDREVDLMQNLSREYEIRLRGAVKSPGSSILKTPERIRIVDPPRDPNFPSKSRLLYVIAGILGSIVLSSAAALCSAYLDPRIFYPEELAELGKLPIIATLPNSEQALPEGDQESWSLRTNVVEQVRRQLRAADEQIVSIER